VILDQDLMKADAASLFKAKVLKTYLNGENVYSK
jgi:predicted amidohydrolase YtcJ